MKPVKKGDSEVNISGSAFTLPKSISRQVKVCQRGMSSNNENTGVKYLWVYVSRESREQAGKAHDGARMNEEQWLGVVDEAASIGANCLVVCVDDDLDKHPEVWRLCQWAQEAYDMKVALYAYDRVPREAEAAELVKLNLSRTCLFVDPERRGEVRHLEERGVHLCDAKPGTASGNGLCKGGAETVCVSAEGRLYTCGVVLGDKEYSLGHVYERPMKQTVKDKALPHAVPSAVCSAQGGCRVCPPRMASELD